MTLQEQRQYCESHCNMEKHVIETANFMGQIKEAVINIKADINVLFDQNKTILKDIEELKREIAGIKIKLFAIGVAGATLFELSLAVIKMWVIK